MSEEDFIFDENYRKGEIWGKQSRELSRFSKMAFYAALCRIEAHIKGELKLEE